MSTTIRVYSPAELKRKNPEGFERAWQQFSRNEIQDIPWGGEIMDSLKATFKAAGIRLTDWEIGPDSYSYVRFAMDSDVRDLSGPRAMAWLENNLLGDLRIPFSGSKRWELAKYGQYYRPGMIKPCPFTGVCFDEDMLESLQRDIKAGESLGDAFSYLATVASKAMESEVRYLQSEEYFLEQSDLQYTKDGRLV